MRKRIDVLQEERKELLDKSRESADNKHDANAIMEKAKQDRDAIRKTFEQLKAARKRRLEELNKAKANLPVNINLKDNKKLVALNMEQLDKEEKAIEHKMKSVASTGQDRANSKELQAIAQKRRVVREVQPPKTSASFLQLLTSRFTRPSGLRWLLKRRRQ